LLILLCHRDRLALKIPIDLSSGRSPGTQGLDSGQQ